MNSFQRLWWEQTHSDYGVLQQLMKSGAAPCHQLHYLQMVTEKLGKAYFWRTNRPPGKSHASFVRFLQALDNRAEIELARIARLFGFGRADDFGNWIPTITPLAHELERLAPSLAGDGPNAEYPWPPIAPLSVPASFDFPVWTQLSDSSRGKQLLRVIHAAVLRFPEYA